MITLYTQEEFDNSKGIDKLDLKCECCGSTFQAQKKQIKYELNNPERKRLRFCSQKCHMVTNHHTKQKVKCNQCEKTFFKDPSQIKASKSGNNFCSKSCAATYNNKHKKHGTRRSKLEKWLEVELSQLYPKLKIDFNKKDAIESELDIYVPSKRLAFEINGIFHYKPIYGQEKLDKIQKNDNLKLQECKKRNINLKTIDVSELKYFKPDRAKKFLDIIVESIDSL